MEGVDWIRYICVLSSWCLANFNPFSWPNSLYIGINKVCIDGIVCTWEGIHLAHNRFSFCLCVQVTSDGDVWQLYADLCRAETPSHTPDLEKVEFTLSFCWWTEIPMFYHICLPVCVCVSLYLLVLMISEDVGCCCQCFCEVFSIVFCCFVCERVVLKWAPVYISYSLLL